MSEIIAIYKTPDGKKFDTQGEAEAYIATMGLTADIRKFLLANGAKRVSGTQVKLIKGWEAFKSSPPVASEPVPEPAEATA